MKKLRCSSCGAELKIEDDKEFAICEHCKTRYKLNEDYNINIKIDDDVKDVVKQTFRFHSVVSKIIIVIAIIIFAFVLYSIISSRINFNNKNGNSENSVNDNSEKSYFNFQFSMMSGTQSGFFIKDFLDTIIRSNKTYDRKVSLIFNDDSTSLEDKIIEIKHSLNDHDKYEVYVNYDEDGYVNTIKIDKLNDN